MKKLLIISFTILLSIAATATAQPIPGTIYRLIDLFDTPITYSGQAGKVLSVNSGETGIEFSAAASGDMTKAVYDIGDTGGVNIITTVDSTDATSFILMVDSATGQLAPKTNIGLTYNATTRVFEIGSTDNSNQISIYHDNTDPYIVWDGGFLHLETTEGTNTNSVVQIKGKGTGAGQLQISKGDASDTIDIFSSGIINTAGTDLALQQAANNDITMFSGSVEGETKAVRIFGFRTGDSNREMRITVGLDVADTVSFSEISNYVFDGNIGIGTTDPNEKLDLEGNMLIDGYIEFESNAAPGTTTNRLYDVAGTIFYNGIDLTAGAGGGNAWSDAVDSDILPTGNDNVFDLGSAAASFADAWMDGTVTANEFIGTTLTVSTAIASDPLLLMQDGDVSIPFSGPSWPDSTTILRIKPYDSTYGGTIIESFTDSDGLPFVFRSLNGATNPTDSFASFIFAGYKSDGGTDIANMGDDESLFSIRNGSDIKFNMLGDGDTTFAATVTATEFVGGGVGITGVTAAHAGTITWTGTAILESGAAFQFGDGTDATLTHTYANTGTNTTVVYGDNSATFSGNVGIGATPLAYSGLRINHTGLDITTPYYGILNDNTKTAGATDQNDDLYGTITQITMNHIGSTIGDLYGGKFTAILSNGTVGSGGGESIYGVSARVTMQGSGVATDDVYGTHTILSLSDTSVTDDVFGQYVDVDISASFNSIGGDVFGSYIQIDADVDPAGLVYGLYLNELTNVDYGIYQNGTAMNYLGGDLTIAGDDLFMGTNTDKFILVADGTNFNTVLSSGDVIISNDGSSAIQANAVALTTDTTGNYVLTVAAGDGITIAEGDSEGSTKTVVATLGTAIVTGEITDGTILEADLNSTNAPTDNYVLSYNSAGLNYTWVAAGTGDLLADGTIPLTANWDVGAYTITGTQFISDIAGGTAPFVVTSTTEVANLTAALATTVTTNANLTGEVTSVGNAATIADSVTVTGWTLGTASATTLTVTNIIKDEPKERTFNVINPLAAHTETGGSICIWPETPADLTVTKVVVTLDSAANEITGDLMWADAYIGKAGATLINDFDTTSGVRSDATITAGAVASGKAMYILYDAPHTDTKELIITVSYDYD